MSGTRCALRFALLVGPALSMGSGAGAQTGQSRTQATGTGPRVEESLTNQAPVGHRQPRASDLPASSEKTAADRERERKERELDKRLRICRNC
jgi:hypothetical protein